MLGSLKFDQSSTGGSLLSLVMEDWGESEEERRSDDEQIVSDPKDGDANTGGDRASDKRQDKLVKWTHLVILVLYVSNPLHG